MEGKTFYGLDEVSLERDDIILFDGEEKTYVGQAEGSDVTKVFLAFYEDSRVKTDETTWGELIRRDAKIVKN